MLMIALAMSYGGMPRCESGAIAEETDISAELHRIRAEAKLAAPPPISAEMLHHAYEENELRADRALMDRWIVLYGEVKTIERSLSGIPCVKFEAGREYDVINCLFTPDQEGNLAKLKKGDNVCVLGLCSGKTLSDIELLFCELEPRLDLGQYLILESESAFSDRQGRFWISAIFRNTWYRSLQNVTITVRAYDSDHNLIGEYAAPLQPKLLKPKQPGEVDVYFAKPQEANKRLADYAFHMKRMFRKSRVLSGR